MDKFCGKCGSEIDSKTGLCPKCNKNKKLLVALIIAIICAFVIVAVFATIVLTDLFSRDKKTEETNATSVSETQEATVAETEKETEKPTEKETEAEDSTEVKTTKKKTTDAKKKTSSTSKKSGNYRDDFISALVANQDEWNTPLFGDGNSMTTRVYFLDLNFDGELELISEYNGGSGGIATEVYGYKNDKIVHYNIDKDATLINIFDYYYDTDEDTYRIYGMDTTSFCFNTTSSHKDKSNYELVVIDDTIYKDFYVCDCPLEGYFVLDRKAHYSLGYIEGSYNYNILGPDEYDDNYERASETRLEGCENLSVNKSTVEATDWKTYSDSEKKKALQKSYDSFSYK